MKAFQRAIDKGFGMEMDVQLSSDGYPVVFHDSTLTRMCGVDKRVNELTLKGTEGADTGGYPGTDSYLSGISRSRKGTGSSDY